MADLTARDAVLVKYLNEAYGKEKQLEIALQAQIGRTQNMPIKKRLREHLKETKAHARGLSSRIKALGGKAAVGVLVEFGEHAAGIAASLTDLGGVSEVHSVSDEALQEVASSSEG